MAKQSDLSIGAPTDDAELRAFTEVVSQVLVFPGADLNVWVSREDHENVRVARHKG